MSGAKIIEGARDAVAWTKATNGGRDLPTEAEREFLAALQRDGELVRPAGSAAPPSVKLRCYVLGWANEMFGAWRITKAGRIVLETRVHQPVASQASEGDQG